VTAERPRGLFVTLEGGEGCGKSTVAAHLAERLRDAGRDAVLTEEPGGSPLGQHFWAYLRDPERRPLSPLAELLLFEAVRAQHVADTIRPALDRGAVVLCDRFGDSSVAYQGYGRGLGPELVELLNATATDGLTPDLTLLLDAPVAEGLRRARSLEDGPDAAKAADAIGGEAEAFHDRVRHGFLEMARAEPERFVVIDATRPLDDVQSDAWEAVSGRLQRRLSLDNRS
jgi:dTMP kinase